MLWPLRRRWVGARPFSLSGCGCEPGRRYAAVRGGTRPGCGGGVRRLLAPAWGAWWPEWRPAGGLFRWWLRQCGRRVALCLACPVRRAAGFADCCEAGLIALRHVALLCSRGVGVAVALRRESAPSPIDCGHRQGPSGHSIKFGVEVGVWPAFVLPCSPAQPPAPANVVTPQFYWRPLSVMARVAGRTSALASCCGAFESMLFADIQQCPGLCNVRTSRMSRVTSCVRSRVTCRRDSRSV